MTPVISSTCKTAGDAPRSMRRPSRRAEIIRDRDDDPQAGRVEEVDVLELECDEVGALLNDAVEHLFQLRRSIDVDLTAHDN